MAWVGSGVEKESMMARGEQLGRQWSILNILKRGKISRRSLAQEFGVSLKTISRDIDTLSFFPIIEEREGIDVLYAFMENAQVPGIWFEPEEVMALVFARDAVLKVLEDTPYHEALAAALRKVEETQRGHSLRQKRHLPDVFQVEHPGSRYVRRLEHDLLQALLSASLEQKRVLMTYFTSSRQELSERVIEPFVLFQGANGFRLIAYCHQRQDVLFFNVNQIKRVEVLEESFELEERRFDLEEFLHESFDGMRALPIVDVRLHVRFPTAHWAKDRRYHPSQTITEVEDGIEIGFRAGGMPAIAARVMGLGPDCRVLEPPALQEMVAQRVVEIGAHYGLTLRR